MSEFNVKQRSKDKARQARKAKNAETGRQIVGFCSQGFYISSSSGNKIVISNLLDKAKNNTVHYHYSQVVGAPSTRDVYPTVITVENKSSIRAALELASDKSKHVGVLNFASAKNPGGGFLRGSMAQEESLCFSSLLYPTLQQYEDQPDHYYQINRKVEAKGVYTDCAIFSPRVPVVRNDSNQLLEEPELVSFVTIPAPNLGAMKKYSDGQDTLSVAKDALLRRVHKALSIFAQHQCTQIVLGAFGCGVFGNDPNTVAAAFRECLEGDFRGVFEKIVFAIRVRGVGKKATANLDAFSSQFAPELQA